MIWAEPICVKNETPTKQNEPDRNDGFFLRYRGLVYLSMGDALNW